MVKNKNALGICVLSFPYPMDDGESITWEDYKKLTGIDLNEIFEVGEDIDDNYFVLFKRSFTKLIALKAPDLLYAVEKDDGPLYSANLTPDLTYFDPHTSLTCDFTSSAYTTKLSIDVSDKDGTKGYVIHVRADKQIYFDLL